MAETVQTAALQARTPRAVDDMEIDSPAAASIRDGRPSWRMRAVLCIPALLTLFVSSTRAVRTLLWRDEFATIQFASLTPGNLIAAVSHVDLIMLPYYGIMEVLANLGVSGIGFRAPSVLAGAGTVAIATVLAVRWWGSVPGFVTGMALCFNPMFVQLSANARPYALATFFAMVATLLLDHARRSNRRSTWVFYALSLGIAGLLQTFAVLVVIAHAILCLRRSRKVKLTFSICVLIVAAITAPLVFAAQGQAQQVGWIPKPGLVRAGGTLFNVLAYQSDQKIGLGDALIAICFAVALLLTTICVFTLRGRQREAAAETFAFSVALFAGPWLVLLVASLVIFPVLTSHYLSTSTVGMALIFGNSVFAIQVLTSRSSRPVLFGNWKIPASAICTAALVGLGPLTAQMVVAKAPLDDFPALRDDIQRRATSGDVIVVAQSFNESGFATGVAYYFHDDSYSVAIEKRLPRGDQPEIDPRVLTSVRPLATGELPSGYTVHRVWLIRVNGSPLTDAARNELTDIGCRPERVSLIGVFAQDRLDLLECADLGR